MSSEPNLVHLALQVSAPDDTDPDQIAHLTRQLRDEMRELDVQSAELARGGTAPEGAKGLEAIFFNEIALSFAAHLSMMVVEALVAWLMRQAGPVRLTLQVGEKTLVLAGTAEGVSPHDRKEVEKALADAADGAHEKSGE